MQLRLLLFSVLFAVLYPIQTIAQSVVYQNGICYKIWRSEIATVIAPENVSVSYADLYSLSIPKEVIYMGKNYPVDTIGEKAFMGCMKLKTIDMPGIKHIQKQAFRDCRALEKLTIPKNIQDMGDEAFMYCSNLKKLVIEEGDLEDGQKYGLQIISYGAFSHCGKLEEVILPSSIKSICNRAFEDCNSLKRFYCLSSTVECIDVEDEGVFFNTNINATTLYHNGLNTSTDPWREFLQYINLNTLDHYFGGLYYNINDKQLTAEVTTDQNNGYEVYTGRPKDHKYTAPSYTIPTQVTINDKKYLVNAIGERAFENHTNLKRVELPEGIRTISANSFRGCTALTSINIPKTTSNIKASAFENCSSLQFPTLPDGLESIEAGAFAGCTSFEKVKIPSSVKSIQSKTFYMCSNLEEITLPENVSYIGSFAFAYCPSLDSIKLPDAVTTIGEQAFRDCKGLTEIRLPQNLTQIGDAAFQYCSELSKVTFSDQINSIGKLAFAGCGKITALSLPLQLRRIGESAFSGCASVTELTIPASVTFIDKFAFADCSKIIHIYCHPMTAPKAFENSFSTQCLDFATVFLSNNDTSYNQPPCWSLFKHKIDASSTYKLSYYVDGKPYKEYEYKPGTVLQPEAKPTSTTRIFSGWSGVPELMPARDTIISGGFSYQATFHTQFYEEIKDSIKTFFYGDSVKAPVSQHIGYHVEWKELPVLMPAEDVTIQGEYARNKYAVTYQIEGIEGIWRTDSILYQDSIKTPADYPTKAGYLFVWESSYPAKMPAHHISIHGYYIPQVTIQGITYLIDSTAKKAIAISYKDSLRDEVINIPDSVNHLGTDYPVTAIGKQAFRDSRNVTRLAIPATIDSIANEAFLYCTKLTDIYCYAQEVPTTSLLAFKGVNTESITLHVPAKTKKDYEAEEPWSSFGVIVDGIKSSSLTYMIDGAHYQKIDDIDEGTHIALLSEPERTYPNGAKRDFSGWEPKLDIMPDSNTIVTGRFKYIALFVFGNKTVKNDTLYFGQTVDYPTEEQLDIETGYHVDWNIRSEKTLMPANDTTFIGTKVVNKYVVTYVVEGEDLQQKDSVSFGAKLTLPNWKRENFELRWKNLPNDTVMPARNITVKGVFEELTQEEYDADGIIYKLYHSQQKAELTALTDKTHEGALAIPADIKVGEKTYQVTAIANRAFYDCHRLTSVMLPQGIDSIGSQAFWSTNITDVYIYGEKPAVDANAFKGMPNEKVLHVAKGTLGQYPESLWKDSWTFTAINEIETCLLTYWVDGAIYEINGVKQQFSLKEGEAISPLTYPEKDGRRFSSWQGLPEDLKMPGKNLEVMGQFEYKLSYELADYSVKPQYYFFGDSIKAPTVDKKEGYHVVWENLPEVMPAKDSLVTGYYTKSRYVVTYKIRDCEWEQKDTLEYKAKILPPTISDSLGYDFDWAQYPATMPAKDITIEGAFTEHVDAVIQHGVTYRIYMVQKRAEVISNKNDNGYYKGTIVIDSIVTYSYKDKEYTYPVTAIAEDAFNGSRQMTAVTLPNTIRTIGKQAFRDCQGLTTITLPASLQDVNDETFLYCTRLANVYCFAAMAPAAGERLFENTPYKTTGILHVPTSSLGSYKKTSPWNLFKTITDIKKVTLRYELDGKPYLINGKEQTFSMTEGDSIHILDDPKGHIFSGWDPQPTLMPDSDVTIRGAFSYILNYVFEEKNILNENKFFGEVLTYPTIEQKDGHAVVWDSLYTTMPANDLSIHGHYATNQYQITFVAEDNDSLKQMLDYGATLTPPDWKRDNYELIWKNLPADGKMPACDTIINGYYQQRTQTITSDGITYRILLADKRAEVIKSKTGLYAGKIAIQAEVTNNGQTYPVTAIAASAFSDCIQLTHVTLPASVDTISAEAFKGCSALTEIILPISVKAIGNRAFAQCGTLTDVYCFNTAVPQTSETAFENTLYKEAVTLHVPSEAKADYAKVAPWNEFFKTENITTHSLTYLVDGMVIGTPEFHNVGDSITPMKEPVSKEGRTFSGWKEEIPAFMPNHDVVITGGFSYQVQYVFEEKVQGNAVLFYGTPLTLPTIADSIGRKAVWENLPADSLMPAKDLTVNGHYDFIKYAVNYLIEGKDYQKDSIAYSKPITPPTVNDSLGYDFAWAQYPATMPAKDITIEGAYTEHIDTIVRQGVTYRIYMIQKHAEVISNKNDNGYYKGTIAIDSIVTYSYKDKEYAYPVTAIAENAFNGSRQMTAVTLPNTIRTIGKQAFRDCQGLTTIILPASLLELSNEAFLYCTKMAHVYTFAKTPPTAGDRTFENTPYKTTGILHVPAGTISQYQSASPWNRFQYITDIKKATLRYVLDGEPYLINGKEQQFDMTEGDKVKMLSDPDSPDDREFSGWTPQLTMMPDSNVTVTGSFAYTIQYFLEEGQTSQKLKEDKRYVGEPLTYPTRDGKEGHTLSWDSVYLTMPARDLVVTAHYDTNRYVVTYVVEGEDLQQKDSVSFGAKLTLPDWKRENFELRWTNLPNDTVMPARNITVKGVFEELTQEEYEAGGIIYKLYHSQQKAEVTALTDKTLEGAITIPAEIKVGEKTYQVTAIANRAFYDCHRLTSVMLPQGIDSIGSQAFWSTNITDVYIYGEKPAIDADAFKGMPNEKVLHVAKGTSDQYPESLWKDSWTFTAINEIETCLLTYWVDGAIYEINGVKQQFSLKEGEAISPLTYPEKDGRRFSGWQGLPEDLKMPGKNIMITGSFEYNIIYRVEDQDVKNQSYFSGDSINAPEIEGREGYHAMWSNLPKTMPAKDITVDGQYTIKQFIITFVIPDEDYQHQDTLDYGADVSIPEVPEREGYLVEWDKKLTVALANDTVHGRYIEHVDTIVQNGVNYRINMVKRYAEVIAKNGTYQGRIVVDSIVTYSYNDSLYSYPVNTIAENAFNGSRQMKDVSLPNTIRTIGKQAFRDCQGLTTIKLPASLQDMSDEAFLYCTRLAHVYCFAKTPPTAGERTFTNTPYKTSTKLHVPAGAVGLYKAAAPWNGFQTITDIKKPMLTYILDGNVYVLHGEKQQTVKTEGEEITMLPDPEKGDTIFSGWYPRLTTMPDSNVNIIGNFMYSVKYTFEKSNKKTENLFTGDSLTYPVIPQKKGYAIVWDSLYATMPANNLNIQGHYQVLGYLLTCRIDGKTLKTDSVAYNSSLTEYVSRITVPERDGYEFFWKSYPATMPANDITIDGYYQQRADTAVIEGVTYRILLADKRAEVIRPAQGLYAGEIAIQTEVTNNGQTYPVTAIAASAFSDCIQLTYVTLPNSIDSIAGEAFKGCSSLTEIVIPRSVKVISDRAFAQCTSLTHVFSLGTDVVSHTSETAFENTLYSEAVTLHVDASARSLYKEWGPWCDFYKIVSITTQRLRYYVDGQFYKQYIVNVGMAITPEPDPVSQEGRTFSGWRESIPTTMPGHDLNINGGYSYHCQFYFEGVSFDNKVFFYGDPVIAPDVTEREGSHIVWENMPMTMPAEDIEVKGHYELNKHLVTYSYNGKVYQQDSVAYSTVITPPVMPEREGWIFVWHSLPETMPNKDITTIGYYEARIFDYQQNGVTYRIYMPYDYAEVVANKENNGIYNGRIVIDSLVTYRENNKTYRYPVTTISDNAFNSSKQMTAVTIPGSVKSIGIKSFRDCWGLTTITLPASLKNLGSEAFRYCTHLAHVYCLGAPAKTGEYVFENTPYKESTVLHVPAAYLSDYQKEEPWSLFYKVTDIKKPLLTYILDGEVYEINGVTQRFRMTECDTIMPLPDPVKDDRLFSGWQGLPANLHMGDQDITVSGNFQYTLSYEFDDLTILPQQYFCGDPIAVPYIEKQEGYDIVWENMPTTMPAEDMIVKGHYEPKEYTVTYYVDDEVYTTYTVHYGDSIKPPHIQVPYGYSLQWESYPTVMPARDLFIHGTYEERIEIVQHEGVTYRVYVLRDYVEVTKNKDNDGYYQGTVTIADEIVFEDSTFTVTAIAPEAFKSSKQLTEVILPSTLTTIGKQAFRDCQKLKAIDIPATVTTIDDQAFLYCASLNTVTCRCIALPTTGNTLFSNTTYAIATLLVPEAAYESYRTTEPWSNFDLIATIETSGLSVIRVRDNQTTTYYTTNGVKVDRLVRGNYYIAVKKDGSRKKIFFK